MILSDKSIKEKLERKNSLSRLALIIQTTTNFLDPMKIAQITFEKLNTPRQNSYGAKMLKSKYFGDMEAKGSQMF